MSEKTAAYGQLADIMRQAFDNHVAETINLINDPELSFAASRVNAHRGSIVEIDEQGQRQIFGDLPVTGLEYAQSTAMLFKETGIITTDGLKIGFKYEVANKAVETLKKNRPTNAVDMLGDVEIATSIAMLSKPDEPIERICKKRQGESGSAKVFRNALFFIGSYARENQQISPEERAVLDDMHRLVDAGNPDDVTNYLLDDSEAGRRRADINNGMAVRVAARAAMTTLRDLEYTGQEYMEDLRASLMVAELEGQNTAESAGTPDANVEAVSEPTAETGWTILPPSVLESLGLQPETAPTPVASGEYKATIDEARLRWLGQIVCNWGPDAYIAVANLQRTGKHDFRVAVLPETLSDNSVIEHAVAENPSTRHATYAFRGEQGLAADGSKTFDWRDVFSSNTTDAKLLGARRILHTINHDDNLLDYITRPAARIEDGGYRR